jgi:hypothetical protein
VGSILRGSCRCGYVTEALGFGGGLETFETYCGVPARCEACGQVVLVDYFSPGEDDDGPFYVCPSCHGEVAPYVEPFEPQGRTEGIRWGELIVPRAGNRCPRCSASLLSFAVVGSFD